MAIDLLSDILGLMQLRGGLAGHLKAGGSWATKLPTRDAIKYHAVTQGACWFSVRGMPEPARLEIGDVLLVNSESPLRVGSDPALLLDPLDPCPVPDTQSAFRYGQGTDFTLLCGGVEVDADHRALLLRTLPPLIRIPGEAPTAPALALYIEQLVRELLPSRQQGRSTAITALAQLLFVQILRAHIDDVQSRDEGWLRVFHDARLTNALGAMHEHPARKWTLSELARVGGMSRTAFAVSFREVMGVPPLAYLTEWRMKLAERALTGGASVAEAAASVGYSSESAFSECFRRHSGMMPGAFRKALAQRGSSLAASSIAA